ncbi:MAG: hypothetical protein GXO59_01155 [Dictyoglomi bacterium]|nr:hypothetical protein [Dictyoglomota bacterium]
MAVKPLKKLEIYAWGNKVPEILEYIASIRDFHVEHIEELQETGGNIKETVRQTLQKISTYLSIWRNAEEFVSLHGDTPFKKSMFEPRKVMSIDEARSLWETKGEMLFNELQKMLDDIHHIDKEIEHISYQIEMLKPWQFITIQLSVLHNLKHLRYLPIEISERYVAPLWEDLKTIDGYYWMWAKKTGKQWYVLIVYYSDKAAQVVERWKEYAVSLPAVDIEPAEYIKELETRRAELEDKRRKQIEEVLRWLNDQQDTYKVLVDYLEVEKEKWQVVSDNVLKGKKFVYLWGWIDKDKADRVKYNLEHNYPVRVLMSDPSEEEDPPVKIENPWWLRPFEIVTKLYGVPHYRFFDPTKFTAPAFFIFFGIALGDAGYGALLMLTALYFLIRYKKAEEGTKNTLLFIFYLGLTSLIFGIVTWTWFGENPFVYNGKVFGFFSFFDVVHNTNLGLGTVLIIGIVMQMYAMSIKAWWSFKQGDWQTAVFDVFAWQVFLLSLVVLVLPIIGVGVSATTLMYAKYIAMGSALLIVLTQGRHIKNPIGRIAFGLISLYGIAGGYGVASFLADTLSYSRLLALNLSTGIVAHVLNTMLAPMFKIVIGIILLILAHALNLALGLLGSFVHSSRLIFLEMYGRFFEGTGREFKPITLDGKYHKFVKEVDAK